MHKYSAAVIQGLLNETACFRYMFEQVFILGILHGNIQMISVFWYRWVFGANGEDMGYAQFLATLERQGRSKTKRQIYSEHAQTVIYIYLLAQVNTVFDDLVDACERWNSHVVEVVLSRDEQSTERQPASDQRYDGN